MTEWLTRSMTENVSWNAAIFLRIFQEFLATSSPTSWRTSAAMSARSIPGGKTTHRWLLCLLHHLIKAQVQPTFSRKMDVLWWQSFKLLFCITDWIPTGGKHLPRSRHHHNSAVWVFSNLIEESYHLTDGREKKREKKKLSCVFTSKNAINC